MYVLFNILISSIIQLIIVISITFILLTIFNKKTHYFNYIGLKKFENNLTIYKLSLIGIISFTILGIYILNILESTENAAYQFNGLGFVGLLPAIIYSFIQTSLTEEIFFRGFLLKIASNKFGFLTGNIIQSILFGSLHGIMFFSKTNIFNVFFITLFTTIIAYFIGYINEKKANGSIIPSWIIHGSCNMITSLLFLFKLI